MLLSCSENKRLTTCKKTTSKTSANAAPVKTVRAKRCRRGDFGCRCELFKNRGCHYRCADAAATAETSSSCIAWPSGSRTICERALPGLETKATPRSCKFADNFATSSTARRVFQKNINSRSRSPTVSPIAPTSRTPACADSVSTRNKSNRAALSSDASQNPPPLRSVLSKAFRASPDSRRPNLGRGGIRGE